MLATLAPARLVALRPRQWLKNGLVLLAFVFSVGQAWQVGELASWASLLPRAIAATMVFCAISSAAYLVNDLHDAERDRRHPTKCLRSIAAGLLRRATAVAAAVRLLLAGGAGAVALGWPFALAAAGYVVLTLLYTFALKQVLIVDLVVLAARYVLRAAGALAVGVSISPWLYVCTFLGALFLAMEKRRHELVVLGDTAAEHRAGLDEYTVGLLDHMATAMLASTLIVYALYTVSADSLPTSHTMLATVPFVVYGRLRYTYLIQRRGAGGSPEDILFRDESLRTSYLLWALLSMAILSFFRR
jgi:4-hydroxybenzoate polyprenyltransferase